MNDTKTSLILGWPTQLEKKRKADANKINSIMRKYNQHDLSYTIQYKGDGHLLTIAPTGSGKGVSVIIPNLLHYSGPTIVIDPKGENFAVTARYRIALGQRIILLDPFKAISDKLIEKYNVKRGRLNPLDLYLLSDTSLENDAEMIANLLSDYGTVSHDPYWDITARRLLSGIIAYEMNMARIKKRSPMFSMISNLLYDENITDNLKIILDKETINYVKKTVGSGFLAMDDRLRNGILTTAQSYLSTVMSGNIEEYLQNSTIDIRDIQKKEDYTLYIVIPPNKLKSHSFLLKMWVSILMHAVMERKHLPNKRTLFILDECANLGEMDVLRQAVTLLRGYGLQVWMFFQDLSQMEQLYLSDFKTMINNCGVLQTFGISRLSGASPLASIIGEYKDTDLLNLDETQQILSIAPGQVRAARLLKYYKDEAFRGRFDVNPLIKKMNNKRTHKLIRYSKKVRFS